MTWSEGGALTLRTLARAAQAPLLGAADGASRLTHDGVRLNASYIRKIQLIVKSYTEILLIDDAPQTTERDGAATRFTGIRVFGRP